ncbi:MAG: beta-lactamase family protein [Spirochaetaceae bacterium]|nr:beta-lactamase family protein [Myxococcales bacterium]MCB9726828.1 beta-lactamase family protein [Spirochaetaceae bacterium]
MTRPAPVHGHCDPRFAKVREVFTKRIADGKEIGAAIAFTLDGEPVVDLWGGYYAEGQGASEREWERDTLVNTYSTTKGMTAICAHRLVEQGRLDLDAPVADYWPEFAQAGKAEVPVRWLLSHRVGLPAIRRDMPHGSLYDWDAMCAALAESEPWWTPGTRHGYHPVTFGHLVGEVVRRIDGRSLGRFFREEVALPLDADFHIGLSESEDHRVSDLIGTLAPTRAQRDAADRAAARGSAADGSRTDAESASRGADDAAKADSASPAAAPSSFLRDMSDPTTMVGRAFNNPWMRANDMNTRAWRAAEIPAANGHGTARALARIYGALARGGEVDGVRVLERESIERARTEQSAGPDATLGGLPMRYGLGFMLRSPVMPLSPSPAAFGHPGAGGSIGMADPEAKVGFGFTMNRMGVGLTGGQTGFAVLRAFYEAL